MEKELVARLRKYDPRAGNLLRTYSVGGRKFTDGTWSVVDATTGAYLKQVRQINGDVNSHLAFDVMAKEEAELFEEREREELLRKTAPARFPKGSEAVRVANPAMDALRSKMTKAPAVVAPAPPSTLTAPPGVEGVFDHEDEDVEPAPAAPDVTPDDASVKKPTKVKIPIKR